MKSSLYGKLRQYLSRLRQKEIARGYSAFASIDAVNLIVGAAIRFVIGGLLGAAALGSFSLVAAMAALVQQFFDLRIGNFTTRYATEWLEQRDRPRVAALVKVSYSIDALTGLLAFALLMLGANWITDGLYSEPRLSPLLRAYALVGLAATVQHTSNGVLKGAAKYKWIAGPKIGMRLLELTAISLTAIATRSLFWILIVIAAKEAATSILSAWLASKALRAEGIFLSDHSTRILAPHRREFAAFIFNTNLESYAAVVISKLDVLILGRLISLDALGVYRLAVSAATSVGLFTEPLRRTLLQVFVRARNIGNRYLLRIIKKTALVAGVVAFGVATVLTLFGGQLISVVLGESHQVTVLLAILSLRYVVEAVSIWSVPLLFAIDLVKVVGLRSVMFLILYPLLLIPLTILGDEIGAAAALLVATTVVASYTVTAGLLDLRRRRGPPEEETVPRNV